MAPFCLAFKWPSVMLHRRGEGRGGGGRGGAGGGRRAARRGGRCCLSSAGHCETGLSMEAKCGFPGAAHFIRCALAVCLAGHASPLSQDRPSKHVKIEHWAPGGTVAQVEGH